MKRYLLIYFCVLIVNYNHGQNMLIANGPGNTYEEINSFFAPGFTAVESPDQLPSGNHSSFGRHIDEIFDIELNKFVFRFKIHINNDNDVSTTSTDRQRVEIKTYGPSPSNMKATLGETVTYKWKFKIPAAFIPSTNFTHIHQIKAVGGDDSDPIFTLTPRKGSSSSPDVLQLIYDGGINIGTNILTTSNLSLFENQWVEVTETIYFSISSGTINIDIKKVSDNTTLLTYTDTNIQTFRSDNTFVRPKWGIYRRILDNNGNQIVGLKDEEILFSDFSVSEGVLVSSDFEIESFGLQTNIIKDSLEFIFSDNENKEFKIYNFNGQEIKSFLINGSQKINVEELASGIYFLKDNLGKTIRFIKK